MQEVHKAISAHSKKQNAQVAAFLELDEKREMYIEEAVQRCKKGEPFTAGYINKVTAEINEMAAKGIAPQRSLVTEKMIIDFARKNG
ncbi:DUF2533 family protein [Bacillus lacus]|uniref:DUF2533 family protein n=2 Tax=Metabacillus lacus TaxID=1983721 RepID=A0A7X2IWA1_9BACI|nr:DUF2533 family protein [Metabacillus lacus]MRX70931.1 DUF2533 family protein [Metabacillus lacus]